MFGANVPMLVHYEPPFQIAEYENRRQAYSVWTMTSPQRVCYFANTLDEARTWAKTHAGFAGPGLMRAKVEVVA